MREPAHVFAYCYNLRGKRLASITLPKNVNVGILSGVVAKAPAVAVDTGIASVILGTTNLTGVALMALTIANESNIGAGGGPLTFNSADRPQKGSVATPTQPATDTTKQITVPMGQQTKIAHVAPDSTSQMTFVVQKPADDCVGAHCSTYLTDWNNGSGNDKLETQAEINSQPP